MTKPIQKAETLVCRDALTGKLAQIKNPTKKAGFNGVGTGRFELPTS